MLMVSKSRLRFVMALLTLVGAATAFSSVYDLPSATRSSTGEAPVDGRPRTVQLAVSLIWEGRDLEPHNLEALRRFRDAYGSIPFIHFISPAYFLRQDPQGEAAKVKALLRPGDRVGLALGGWRSLATKAGVIYRDGPTFWGQVQRPNACGADCGQDVPVHVYPQADLVKMIDAGVQTLNQMGFGRVRALATSGWVASPEVLEAAAIAGMRYDFSAVAPEMLMKRARNYPLYGWTKDLWGQVTPHTQPYALATASASLIEVPQSLGAIDYVGAAETTELFKEYAEITRRDAGASLTFPLTFYQETASMSLPVVRSALTSIFGHASSLGIAIAPLDLPEMEAPTQALPMGTGAFKFSH